ncbi:Spore coat protein SA [Aquisphaera giovannonii]|uniref:Spore coat protein SA n=1 Tax=Aquisphaera giovannonii TaxID=406548 RepID=A0A5B9W4M8_9BACT|nr:glycosyltransferase [Aquisphaera giovannonii]QEH35606.1 Spore coat protein SA [Aquisphaera giovannonii]
MHVLFVHQNYPAQFGHIARHLAQSHGFRCTFVSQRPEGESDGVRRIRYHPKGGATARNHYCSRTFENAVHHTHAVYEACKAHPEIRPDLVVGHSGFGSTLFLRELYDCPIINYFEYFYRAHGSDLDFRPEMPPGEMDVLRSYCRNATLLLDLENCDAGYSPTRWQWGRLPRAYADKVRVIFDGVDTSVWRRIPDAPRRVGDAPLPRDKRIVTYVSRGFESMRGFDIFMKVAKRIYERYPDVLFVVVGSDRVAYGGDLKHVPEGSFREHVLAQDDYDPSKFLFAGNLAPHDLAALLSAGDLHIYLTVPFVLSWSLFDALACGCVVVASDTGPVTELIAHGENGLLGGFFDVEALAELSLRVLRDPASHRHLGEAGMRTIRERYALEKCLPRMLDLYRSVAGRR